MQRGAVAPFGSIADKPVSAIGVGLKHEGEILTAHEWRAVMTMIGPNDLSGRLADEIDGLGAIDQTRAAKSALDGIALFFQR
ncbi:hypothetical protein [Asaia sp. HN010]|uniref:hypothetical protein n=1 Tax=Asaia sp. HN010 TaxID=3081233 RepID=UPI003015AB57